MSLVTGWAGPSLSRREIAMSVDVLVVLAPRPTR